MEKYNEIINLPHHVSDFHKPMPMAHRAAQFASFSALSGLEDALDETSRLTDVFKELSKEEKKVLSLKLNYAIEKHSLVEVSFFVRDKTKQGGSYKRIKARIKKWEEYDNLLIMQNGNKIPVDIISDIKILDRIIDFEI